MSSISLDIYVGPKSEEQLSKIPDLFQLLVDNRFAEIREKYPDFVGEDLDEFFGCELHAGMFKGGDTYYGALEDGAYNFEFLTSTRFDASDFISALQGLEDAELEAHIFYDQVGEAIFIKNGISYEGYDEIDWKWLSGPSENPFEDEYVAVTGGLGGYSREGLKSMIQGKEGTFETSVTERTTLLVVGSRPKSSEVAKAKEMKIRTLTKEQFLKLEFD